MLEISIKFYDTATHDVELSESFRENFKYKTKSRIFYKNLKT